MDRTELRSQISMYLSGESEILCEIAKKLTEEDTTKKLKSIAEFVELLRKSLNGSAPAVYKGLALLQDVLLNCNDPSIVEGIKNHLGEKLRSLRKEDFIFCSDKTVGRIRQTATEIVEKLESNNIIKVSENINNATEHQTLPSSSKSTAEASKTPAYDFKSVKMSCKRCRSKDEKTIKFPCGCSNKNHCLKCARLYIVDHIKGKRLRSKSDEIKCPRNCKAVWDRTWIIGCLTFDQAEEYRKSQFDSDKFQIVECPQCKCPAYMGEDMFLGQCGICDTCFCTNCKGSFHGLSECPTPIDTDKDNDTKDKNMSLEVSTEKPCTSTSVNSKDHKKGYGGSRKSQGAEALGFELDFYAEETNLDEINRKINDAFEINSISKDTTLFPWDLAHFNSPYSSYDFGKYICLQSESWLDDVTIEKSIRALFANETSSELKLLDSFVMSAFFKLPTNEFNKMVKEKEIKRDETVFALLNTDIQSVGGHWMLGTIDQKNKMILIQDTSIVLSPTFYRKFFYFLLNVLHVARNGLDFNPSEWKLCVIMDTIQQRNAYDCGAYLIANAYAYIHGQTLDTPPDSNSLREWIHLLLATQDAIENDNKMDTDTTSGDSSTERDSPLFLPRNLNYIYCCNDSLQTFR